jgi:branched-chain amino acid transport system substrate-binding protein
MQKIKITLIFVICVAICAPLLADTIKIGAILSLTGNSAGMGQSMRDGILLAVDEVNKRGGVNGNKIEMIIEDSKSDPKTAVDMFNKIELSQPPLFYLTFLSSVGVALGPLVDEKKVVLVALSSNAPALTRNRQFVYQYWPTVQADVPPILLTLQDLKIKKLGIIYSNEVYGIEEQQSVAKAFKDVGGSVVTQSIELMATDFNQQIEALKNTDAIFISSLGTSLTNVIHQLREIKYAGHILIPGAGANPTFFILPEMQGIYLSAPIIYNPEYLYARDIAVKFTARYQKPLNHWAAIGYDFIKLISGLFEDHSMTRQSIRDILAKGFEYSGVFGQVRLKLGEHVIAFPMYAAQILNNTLNFR